MAHIAELWIQNEQEVHLARQWTQKLTRLVKLSIGNQARLTTAVSQVAQSLHFYTPCVHLSYDIHGAEGEQSLQVTLRESQNFIPAYHQSQPPALSRQDLLKWLGSTQNLVKLFSIHAEEEESIEVVLAEPIPSWTAPIKEEDLMAWRDVLTHALPPSLFEEILQQNQELVQVLDDLREKEKVLEQKIVEIQKLEDLRDELIHALIHDLRNPLATIRSSLSGLLYNDTKNLSPYQYAMIETSYLGVRKMTRFVNNVMDMHKLERDGIPLVMKPFSVSQLIKKIIKDQTPLAQEKKIRLTRHIAHHIPLIEGDVHLIERVLQNLIDNALKFTPEAGYVTVSAKRLVSKGPSEWEDSPQKQFVHVFVKDTGTGIAPEIETRLFEKFTTGLHEERGSGLGLAFCRMVIHAHGGEIWARNNKGQGATFAFILPQFPASKDANDG